MISFNTISEIELTIIVGIESNHDFFIDLDDIRTVPFTFTFFIITIITISISEFYWTMFFSPLVFA
jgi:hypothetical protein